MTLVALVIGAALLRPRAIAPGRTPRARIYKMLAATGLLFLAAGLIVNPRLTGILPDDVDQALRIAMDVALGWAGLLMGSQFSIPTLKQIPRQMAFVASLQALGTAVIVGIATAIGVAVLYPDADLALWLAAPLFLAVVGADSSPTLLAIMRVTGGLRGQLVQLVRFTTAFDSLISVMILGIVFAFLHFEAIVAGEGGATGWAWLGISLGIGGCYGWLYRRMARHTPRGGEGLLVLVGMIVFTAMTASLLHLSPLFVCLVVGVVMATDGSVALWLNDELAAVEQTFFLSMCFMAGVMWDPIGLTLWPLVATYFVARVLGKFVFGHLSGRLAGLERTDARKVWLGLLDQGGISIALAASVVRAYPSPEIAELTQLVLTAALVSQIISRFGAWAGLSKLKRHLEAA